MDNSNQSKPIVSSGFDSKQPTITTSSEFKIKYTQNDKFCIKDKWLNSEKEWKCYDLPVRIEILDGMRGYDWPLQILEIKPEIKKG